MRLILGLRDRRRGGKLLQSALDDVADEWKDPFDPGNLLRKYLGIHPPAAVFGGRLPVGMRLCGTVIRNDRRRSGPDEMV